MADIVRTQGLCKQYGKVLRVDRLDLRVPEGAIYGFLGPNGAGKSTTLKMILGLVHPTAGSISVFGKEVDGHNRLDMLKQVGSLIESPSYYGHLTGEENLKVVQTLRGVPEKDVYEGAGDRPAGGAAQQKGGPLLPGHEAAAGAGRRPAGLSPAADPGRAYQRPGPGGHPGDAGAHLLPARPVRHDGAGVQPPPERDRPDGRPRGHHPGGGAGLSGHPGDPPPAQPPQPGPAYRRQRGGP